MTDHYSGDGYSRQSRLGATRRHGPTPIDMAGVVIMVLFFMLCFVGAFAVSMENDAQYYEQQNLNAENCIALAIEAYENDDRAFIDYMHDAREATQFDNKPCK